MSLRPKILYPLFSSLNNIPGIGPRTTKLIEKITAPNLFGLCKHLPTNLLTRKRIIKFTATTHFFRAVNLILVIFHSVFIAHLEVANIALKFIAPTQVFLGRFDVLEQMPAFST